MALVEAERQVQHVTTTQQRYDLLIHALDALTVNQLVREHWGIENRVDWVLDVTFHEEDAGWIRTRNAPQNIGVLRHIVLNVLRQEPSKGSLTTKCFRAALNDAYLAHILGL